MGGSGTSLMLIASAVLSPLHCTIYHDEFDFMKRHELSNSLPTITKPERQQ
jgi:hypothetical protein